MSPPATISIAMATYNGADFIREQLDSFAAQSLLPNELIITDDGSTDGTRAIVDDFARTAPFAVHFHTNSGRLGYSRNFEAAVMRCSGDIIFLSDQDDVWFANKLAFIMAAFDDDEKVQVIVNDQLMTDGELSHDGVTKLQNLQRLGVSSDGLIEGCCTAFRQRFGGLLLPFPDAAQPFLNRRLLSHDRWINEFAIALKVRSVVPRPLQYFRRYGSNTTDWFVSEPRPVGTRDLIARRVARAPVKAWLERVELLNFFRYWLLANRALLEREDLGCVGDALDSFARESASLEARSALVCMPAHWRFVAIIRLFAGGGYRYFYGWKSAIRDSFRRA